MINILLTGSSGFLGLHLLPELIRSPHIGKIYCPSRKELPAHPKVIHLSIVDLGDINHVDLPWHTINIVIHLAASAHGNNRSNTESDEYILEKLLKKITGSKDIEQFIYISSIAVFDGKNIYNRTITEESPFTPTSPYALSKCNCEHLIIKSLLNTNINYTIIYPPLIIGKGAKGSILSLTKAINKRIPLPFSNINNQKSYILVEDLVNFISICLQNKSALNQRMVVAADEPISTKEICDLLASWQDKKPFYFPIPVSFIGNLAKALGHQKKYNQIFGSLVIDASKAKKLLNWSPTPIIKSIQREK